MGHTSVEDILNDAEQAEEVATPEAPPVEDRPRDEHGRFIAKETGEGEAAPAVAPEAVVEPPAAPPAAEPQQRTAPLAALEDERRKRQELERRLQQLEASYQQPQPQPQQPVQIPDPVMEPEAFAAYQDDQRYFDRLAISARFARMEHGAEKFEKMKEWGYAKCEADPRFNMLVRQSQDPFSVVNDEYQRETVASELAGVGSLDDLKAKIRAELEAEALEKLKAQVPAPSVPQTLAGERNIGARTGPAWSGPASIEDLLTP